MTVDDEFRFALARLLSGQPRHPDLVHDLREGKLRLSVSTVALEAGRSRTLIGHARCKFPKVREEILKAIESGPTAARARDLLRSTTARITELEDQLAQVLSINAALELELTRLRTLTEAKKLRSVGSTK